METGQDFSVDDHESQSKFKPCFCSYSVCQHYQDYSWKKYVFYCINTPLNVANIIIIIVYGCIDVCQNGDITNIERRIELCRNDSTLLGVVTVTATVNISYKCSQKGDTDILAIISGMFGGISCFSNRLPSLQANDGSNCTSMSETCYSNQTLRKCIDFIYNGCMHAHLN